MDKINVLGIDLNNYSLKESLYLTDKYLSEGALQTILYVTAEMLVQAGVNDAYKDNLMGADMTVIGDAGILEALPNINHAKVEDVKEEKYLQALMRRLAYGRKKILLLADTQENLQALKKNLTDFRSDLTICGEASMEAMEDNVERMVNHINDIIPTLIISRMEPVRQSELMAESKMMINARVWIGLPERNVLTGEKRSIWKGLWSKIFHKSFKKKVQKYETDKTE